MEIQKNNNIYKIKENLNSWTIKKVDGKLEINCKILKDVCKTKKDIEDYILNNDMF